MALVIRDDRGDFDEEATDREEAQIEQFLQEFEDEQPIQHDIYPETETDSEGEDEEGAEDVRRERQRKQTHIRRGDGRLYQNQTFFNGVAFKECVLDYVLRTGRNLKQYRYDKDKIGFKCVGGVSGVNDLEENKGCAWQVYASTLPNDAMWRVRLFVDEHSCVPNGECEMFKVPVIARMFVDKIREEPDYYMHMKIEEIVMERWKIVVSRPQCQAARNKALRWIDNDYDQQFDRLKDYAAELVESNKDSSVEIDTFKNAKGEDVFNRFYVCFDVLRRTWKETCRPLIGIDGTFISGKVKGQVLVVLGRDANNAIYPIAWSCVQVENTDNWLWFIRKVKADLGLNDGDGYIIVSDRQKGLIKAVKDELPKAEHRKCAKHIYGNLKKNHGSKKHMKPLIWNLAWSYNEAQFRENLDRLFNYDSGVFADVQKTDPKTWCRAFYKMGNYCQDVENNSTESFNKTIKKARGKAFIPMLETIRRLAMVRIAKRSAISHDHKGICTPYVTKFLATEHKKASSCVVSRSTNGYYEVRLNGCSYRVNLEKRTCSCFKFDICGIPCEHAYGVIMVKKLVAEDFVSHWFRTSTWRRNYVEGLVPVRGARFWPQTEHPNVHVPPQPEQPGSKKVTKAHKKRKKGVNESPTKKVDKVKKRIMHCGICGVADHNSRFHKNDHIEASQGEPSQGTLTQA